jgi:hypothetical protein
MTTMPYVPAQFCLDCDNAEGVFKGLSGGRTRDGWQMPYLPFEEMQRLIPYMERLNRIGWEADGFSPARPYSWYAPDRDRFIFVQCDVDEADVDTSEFRDEVEPVVLEGHKYYDMANIGWCWNRHMAEHEATWPKGSVV